ncbi:uncharacterized protein K444DRAFT_705348, partial [Hyaloscypha bicolor E]
VRYKGLLPIKFLFLLCLARRAAGRLNVNIVAVTIATSSFSMESVIEGCSLRVPGLSSKNDPVTHRISKPAISDS